DLIKRDCDSRLTKLFPYTTLFRSENFRLLRQTVPDFRKRAWAAGLNQLDIEDDLLAEELALIFPEDRKKHVYLYNETIEVLEKLKGKYELLMLTNGSRDLQRMKLSL